MTLTVIALLSIVSGIIGANLFGFIQTKYTFGIVGNTIAGVFGSIFIIKSFGRLGFNPTAIMETGEPNFILLALNITISLLSGVFGVYISFWVKSKMNR